MRLIHIGVHNSANDNAGDTLLFEVVRWLFERYLGPIEWELIPVWSEISTSDARAINQRCDGVVVGGGGLFLRDQAGAQTVQSGWQWNIGSSAIEMLDVPVILFAVGYNRFRGQPDFESHFGPNIEALLKKSVFFGLRNTGSIKAIRSYVAEELWPAVRLQPCPTTVLNFIDPGLSSSVDRVSNRLALNVAYDRPQYRSQSSWEDDLASIVSAARLAAAQGWKIDVVAHKAIDKAFFYELESASVNCRAISLSGTSPRAISEYYASVSCAVGMRGHAQMIPLGLGKPIFSIISHDKMRFLLDDIGQPQWGCELSAPDFTDRFLSFLNRVSSNYRDESRRAVAASQGLWSITEKNMTDIASVLKASS